MPLNFNLSELKAITQGELNPEVIQKARLRYYLNPRRLHVPNDLRFWLSFALQEPTWRPAWLKAAVLDYKKASEPVVSFKALHQFGSETCFFSRSVWKVSVLQQLLEQIADSAEIDPADRELLLNLSRQNFLDPDFQGLSLLLSQLGFSPFPPPTQ